MNPSHIERVQMHQIARNLWPHQIEGCESGETLLEWYLACREFSDDLIAQIEAEDYVGLRDASWKRAVSGYLVGCRKNLRKIERRAAQLGVELPGRRSDRLRQRIAELESHIGEVRQHERGVIADYLCAVHGESGAEIAELIRGKAHHSWRRQVPAEDGLNTHTKETEQ